MVDCCLCDKRIRRRYSHNAEPVKKGRCCDECNITKVLPARIERLFKDGPVWEE